MLFTRWMGINAQFSADGLFSLSDQKRLRRISFMTITVRPQRIHIECSVVYPLCVRHLSNQFLTIYWLHNLFFCQLTVDCKFSNRYTNFYFFWVYSSVFYIQRQVSRSYYCFCIHSTMKFTYPVQYILLEETKWNLICVMTGLIYVGTIICYHYCYQRIEQP